MQLKLYALENAQQTEGSLMFKRDTAREFKTKPVDPLSLIA